MTRYEETELLRFEFKKTERTAFCKRCNWSFTTPKEEGNLALDTQTALETALQTAAHMSQAHPDAWELFAQTQWETTA